jgi:PAS domain S-box-containing protein
VQGWVIVTVSFAYLGVLFAIAYYGDKRADAGRSIIARPTIYALSLAVYCTAWTFYGSVGRAASTGIGFLPIYLGPTLMAGLWWFVMLKIIRISKVNRITSIADFIASRYGKSQMLGGLVTVIAVVGVMPYISLQLKAVSNSFTILLHYPNIVMPAHAPVQPFFQDSALYIAMILAAFTIVFGTRHLDATERHEGMVAAVAFESLVKLLAFLAVGVFVTFGIYNGVGDIFHRAEAVPKLKALMTMADSGTDYVNWGSLTFLSMLSIMLLPRQFQIAVVENVSEQHLARATWLFPLYLLLINIFVLPITLGGLLHFPDGSVDADTFVLTLPMAAHREALALFVFIGGLSAATAMVIVETIALSTMVCNDLVMPVLLRQRWLRLHEQQDLSGVLLSIRRWAIAGILLLGYVYFRGAGEAYALVSIGLISFAAVAQFAPSIFGAIYWKEGTKNGAIAGLLAGFAVWGYTLLLPSFAQSGWFSSHFIDEGLFGAALLKPHQLFGVSGLDEISHGLFWSMLINIAAYIGVSLAGRPGAVEIAQATLFVDVFRRAAPGEGSHVWRGSVPVQDLLPLIGRFLGPERAREAFLDFARQCGLGSIDELQPTAELMHYAETLLAGAIGSASARVMVASVAKEEQLGLDEVMNILDEASQARAYSRQLEQKSRELEETTAEVLRERANLLDLTHDTVFVRDINNIITFWNRGAETLYGWTRDEVIGQVAHNLLRTIFPAPFEEMTAELNSTGRWEGELTCTRRNGTQVVVASRWALQVDERGNPIGVLETANDITEQKRVQETLENVQAELAHVARVATLGEMSASIAHEINQPLGAIVNSANACLRWLEQQKLEEARRSVARVVGEGYRATEIIGRIRALAKKTPPRKDWLDINDTIREVIALARGELQRNGIALDTRLSDDVRYVPLILADRVQVQQVILNLIINAIEAMSGAADGPRELLIRSGIAESQRVFVAVRDSGPGLDPKSLDHLFDAFYTTKPEGMGMGLAISRSIIDAHGGRLWAIANDDRGATFQFTLPTGGERAA